MNHAREEEFQRLYRRYYPRICHYFVKMRFTPDDARDLAQETFIRLYESMRTYRGDAEWAFLERCARSVALNRIRSAKTLKRSAAEDSLEATSEAVDITANPFTGEALNSPESHLLEQELQAIQKERLRAAIEGLSPGMRECILLWIQGFTYEQIAATLQISVDKVKSRLRDSRKILRRQLE